MPLLYQRIIYTKERFRSSACDGYSRRAYEYKKDKGIMPTDGKGTVIEILGDYYHSNPEYYSSGLSPKEISGKTISHNENYKHTMNRLKHIEEEGYKVYYIWVSDFKRFRRDLEKGLSPHLFDYMNIEKKYISNPDYSLLPRGSRKMMNKILF